VISKISKLELLVKIWGDFENFEIGITRQDFRVRATLVNTFILFGTAFTDSQEALRGYDWDDAEEIRDYYRVYPNDKVDESINDYYTIGMGSKRIGEITEKVYTYPPEISDVDIDAGNVADDGSDMILVDPSNYSIFKRNGDFVFIINCNRDKILTNDFGDEVSTNWDNLNGVFTKFRGFITLEITSTELSMSGRGKLRREKTQIEPYRIKLKFPQHAASAQGFTYQNDSKTVAWRKQHATFETGKFYSVSRFHGITFNNIHKDYQNFDPMQAGPFFRKFSSDQGEWVNYLEKGSKNNVGVILTEDIQGTINNFAEFPSNRTAGTNRFGANWMNFAIYLPQLGKMIDIQGGSDRVKGVLTADYFHPQWEDEVNWNKYFLFGNSMPLAAGMVNTEGFARSDLHWTDIIEVPLDDIISINSHPSKGFTSTELTGLANTNYRNGTNIPTGWTAACPYSGGKVNGVPSGGVDSKYYFYKGFDAANVFEYIFELGLVT